MYPDGSPYGYGIGNRYGGFRNDFSNQAGYGHSNAFGTSRPSTGYLQMHHLNNFQAALTADADKCKLTKLCKDHNIEDPFAIVTWYSNQCCCKHHSRLCEDCHMEYGTLMHTNTSAATNPPFGYTPAADGWDYYCNYGFPMGTLANADLEKAGKKEKRSARSAPASRAQTPGPQQAQVFAGGPSQSQPFPSAPFNQPFPPAQQVQPGMVAIRVLDTGKAAVPTLANDESYIFPWFSRRIVIQDGSTSKPTQVPDMTVWDLTLRLTEGIGNVRLTLQSYAGVKELRKEERVLDEARKMDLKYGDRDCQPMIIVTNL